MTDSIGDPVSALGTCNRHLGYLEGDIQRLRKLRDEARLGNYLELEFSLTDKISKLEWLFVKLMGEIGNLTRQKYQQGLSTEELTDSFKPKPNKKVRLNAVP